MDGLLGADGINAVFLQLEYERGDKLEAMAEVEAQTKVLAEVLNSALELIYDLAHAMNPAPAPRVKQELQNLTGKLHRAFPGLPEHFR